MKAVSDKSLAADKKKAKTPLVKEPSKGKGPSNAKGKKASLAEKLKKTKQASSVKFTDSGSKDAMTTEEKV